MNHLLALQVAVYALAAQNAPSWRDPSSHQVRMITVDSVVKLEVLDRLSNDDKGAGVEGVSAAER